MLKLLLILAIFTRPMEVTAYCGCESCCGNHSPGITASGYIICQGDKLIAASTAFPFGTEIYIPGYGRSLVKDRGGSIKGNRLDVYFDSHQEALEWGRRKVLVIIFPGE